MVQCAYYEEFFTSIFAVGKRCQIYDVMSSSWVAVLGNKKTTDEKNKQKIMLLLLLE